MSIYKRKMFNKGGLATPKRGYVDGPGSYQGIGDENLPEQEIFMGTKIPSLDVLMQRNLPVAQSIVGS